MAAAHECGDFGSMPQANQQYGHPMWEGNKLFQCLEAIFNQTLVRGVHFIGLRSSFFS
jgi:hypothetical protein